MAGKSTQSNNRGAALDGFFASGKDRQFHTAEFGSSYVVPQYGSPDGHTATGGVINDFINSEDGKIYRTHIFT